MKKRSAMLTLLILFLLLCLPITADAGWKKTSKGTYRYYNTNGKLLKNCWIGDYYVDKKGNRLTDQWIGEGTTRYFVGRDGKWIPNFKGGWQQIKGKWYYYKKSGVTKKGWFTVKGKKYYTNKKTGARYTGWHTINGKKYYFNSKTGIMAAKKWVGDSYVNANGIVTKTRATSYEIKMDAILQNPELPTGCESVALTNVLNYYKFPLKKTTIADNYLEYSSYNFVSAYIGNPRSFDGAGCYAPAITNAANKFLREKRSGLTAVDLTGTSFTKLYKYVEAGNPVIVWNTMYMMQPVYTDLTYYENGRTYRWYGREHCVVLCGYDKEKGTVLINDPLDGIVVRNARDFESLYNQMGKMAVLIR